MGGVVVEGVHGELLPVEEHCLCNNRSCMTNEPRAIKMQLSGWFQTWKVLHLFSRWSDTTAQCPAARS